jgi:hypothetical protein
MGTTLCDKVCQWLAVGHWFSPGYTSVSSTNKTNRHKLTGILLKVVLSNITKLSIVILNNIKVAKVNPFSVYFSGASSCTTDHQDITEILLKVALNTINPNSQLEAPLKYTLNGFTLATFILFKITMDSLVMLLNTWFESFIIWGSRTCSFIINISMTCRGRYGRDPMVVGFTTTYASPLMLWVQIPLRRGVLSTTLWSFQINYWIFSNTL